jgi:putative iron-regulated protein
MSIKTISLLLLLLLTAVACKKSTTNSVEIPTQGIVEAISTNVTFSTYKALHTSCQELESATLDFSTSPTAQKLETCKVIWKNARASWELSEAFLYGPVATGNIDARIDSWPVDFTAIELLLTGTINLSDPSAFAALNSALKGFHPIEYLLWGEHGQKSFSEFTPREFQYLVALAKNMCKLTEDLDLAWNPSLAGSFYHLFTSPSSINTHYTSYNSVYKEIVNSMVTICEEVATAKMKKPFNLQDPKLEESPFSSNSINDFVNNIKSVQNVYLGSYTVNGLGIEDLVREYNLSLDNEIKTAITKVISDFNQLTVPFGKAIISQPEKIQQIITSIESLKAILQNKLLPFIQQYIKN